ISLLTPKYSFRIVCRYGYWEGTANPSAAEGICSPRYLERQEDVPKGLFFGGSIASRLSVVKENGSGNLAHRRYAFASSPARRHCFQVRPLTLVRLGVGQHLRVRLDAPAGAGLTVHLRPPGPALRQSLVADRVPVAEDLRPARVAVVDGLLP